MKLKIYTKLSPIVNKVVRGEMCAQIRRMPNTVEVDQKNGHHWLLN